jgi:hypothetical protein
MIATYPVGGVVWDYGQYALGLERLGWEVYYLEDTGGPTYDPHKREYGEDCSFGVGFLDRALADLSPHLARRWHFRAMDGRTFGLSTERMQHVLSEADLFLNVSGSALLRDEHMSCPRKVLIDTDPGWNHFVNYPKWDQSPGWLGTHGYRAHDYFFTYAEGIGRPGCRLPSLELEWRPTRPPVVLDCWHPAEKGERWTTVMTWNNFGKPVEYGGMVYGTKEMEFGKVETLPRYVQPAQLELATGGSGVPFSRWQDLGWHVIDSHGVSKTHREYQGYIQRSRGEFSVAKNLYVATGSGWFSCRSVCYLAAGRPVVVQDTGFSEHIPTGEGLFAFRDLGEAVEAIRTVEADYSRHQEGALVVAREQFGSATVLGKLLEEIGLA